MIDSKLIPEEVWRSKRPHLQKRLAVLCGLLNEGDIVLDIGCGIGSYVTDMLGYLPVRVVAIDCDQKSIAYAQNANRHVNVTYLYAYGQDFRQGKYDMVICSHVIEHMYSPQQVLKNVKNLMKDDGIFYLALPNGYGCFELENFIPRNLAKTGVGKRLIDRLMERSIKDSMNHDNPHIQFFTFNSVTKLLRELGYDMTLYVNDQILGGVITDRTLLRLPFMAWLNTRVADFVPSFMANGWIIICQKN